MTDEDAIQTCRVLSAGCRLTSKDAAAIRQVAQRLEDSEDSLRDAEINSYKNGYQDGMQGNEPPFSY